MLRDPAPEPGRRLKVALYSHDAQGFGHVRRNLAIAGSLAGEGAFSALLITGARSATSLPLPAGVDCLSLPALRKSPEGDYATRSLGISLGDLMCLRARMIQAALDSYEPDLLIVDKHPLGIRRELAPALETLALRGTTRLVLGLRDVLDEPAVVAAEWRRDRLDEAVAALYDAVWVYGDPRVYDAVREYDLPAEVASRSRYTGYVCRLAGNGNGIEAGDDGKTSTNGAGRSPSGTNGQRLALCMVGGGGDGLALARSFALAERPADMAGTILAGPLMDAEARAELRAACDQNGTQVVDFARQPERLLAQADRVVSMGGYNAVCEILATRRRALIVPRVKPRREQQIRAERFEARGLLELLHPDRLDPATIADWLAGTDREVPDAGAHCRMDGLERVRSLALDLAGSRRGMTEVSAVAA